MPISETAPLNARPTAASASRRRSQRVFLQVAVIVEGQPTGDSRVSEKARTIVVNAHGALIEMTAPQEQGKTVFLKNAYTNETQESRVVLITAADAGKFNVALEFVAPNPNFWRISFPPDDWSARHENTKPRQEPSAQMQSE